MSNLTKSVWGSWHSRLSSLIIESGVENKRILNLAADFQKTAEDNISGKGKGNNWSDSVSLSLPSRRSRQKACNILIMTVVSSHPGGHVVCVRVSVVIVEDQHGQQDAARHHAHDEVEIRP